MDSLTSSVEALAQSRSRLRTQESEDSLEQVIQLFHLCTHVRPTASVGRRIHDLAGEMQTSAGWQTLVQLAVDHRVLPLVSHNLHQFASGQAPQDLLTQLEHQARYSKRRIFGLTGSLLQVTQQLQEQGIEAIPFKGLLLSLEAYGSPNLRQFDDIDIWVQPDNFFLLREALAPQGYLPNQTFLSKEVEQQYCWQMGEYSLIEKESNVGLDIHHRLMAGDCSMTIDFTRCWSRAEEIQVMGHALPTLRREDLMIYLCANGMKDGWSYLRAVCDVAALMTHEIPLDWAFVLAEAKSMKALRMVRLGVLLAHRLLEVPLPIEVAQLRQDRIVLRMGDRICLRLSSPERPDAEEQAALEKLVLRFLANESLSARGAYLGRVIGRVFQVATHVTSKDRQFVALPERWNFLYYVIRPVRILSEHRRNLLTVSGYRMFR